jgi:hypothetical protein
MKTAWHQQYCGLVKKGQWNPDPGEQFMVNLGKYKKQEQTIFLDGMPILHMTTMIYKTSCRIMIW